MPRASAFVGRIRAAAKWRATTDTSKAAAAELARQRKIEARDKAVQLAWKVREEAWSALQATAAVLGGTCGRGGDALELRGVERPVRIEIGAGDSSVCVIIVVEWGGQAYPKSFTTLTAAVAWIQGQIEAAVRGVPIVARRKAHA